MSTGSDARGTVPVSRRILLAAISILAAGMIASGSIWVWAALQPGPPAGSYEAAVTEVIREHNELSGRWNDFLTEFNSTRLDTLEDFYAQYRHGYRTSGKLVVDSQAVIADWARIQPPEHLAESHQLGLLALQATQDGFIQMEAYFYGTVTTGYPSDDLAAAAQRKLDEAGVLWEQARAATAGAQ